MVRKLKGCMVVDGDADFPAATHPTPPPNSAENKTTGPQPDTPLARALMAGVDLNARKSLDRR
jgi:hypothetical protein